MFIFFSSELCRWILGSRHSGTESFGEEGFSARKNGLSHTELGGQRGRSWTKASTKVGIFLLGLSVGLTKIRKIFDPNTSVELELELIQTQMAQKPMLRAEVGMRVRCANKASAE